MQTDFDEEIITKGDRVKIPEPTQNVNESTKWLYGEVVHTLHGGTSIAVQLDSHYEGLKTITCPLYMAHKIGKYSKNPTQVIWGADDKKEVGCSHEWVVTGSSPITNQMWYNCKHCEIAKEKL